MYNPQILALQAAAAINGDGTTPITYGCSITRFSNGIYKIILPTGLAVIDAQTFTKVTAKGSAQGIPVVSDDNAGFIKIITMFDNVEGGVIDCGLEAFVQRSTINPF